VHVPNDLAEQATGAERNVSALAQGAFAAMNAAQSTDAWLVSLQQQPRTNASHHDVLIAVDAD